MPAGTAPRLATEKDYRDVAKRLGCTPSSVQYSGTVKSAEVRALGGTAGLVCASGQTGYVLFGTKDAASGAAIVKLFEKQVAGGKTGSSYVQGPNWALIAADKTSASTDAEKTKAAATTLGGTVRTTG